MDRNIKNPPDFFSRVDRMGELLDAAVGEGFDEALLEEEEEAEFEDEAPLEMEFDDDE